MLAPTHRHSLLPASYLLHRPTPCEKAEHTDITASPQPRSFQSHGADPPWSEAHKPPGEVGSNRYGSSSSGSLHLPHTFLQQSTMYFEGCSGDDRPCSLIALDENEGGYHREGSGGTGLPLPSAP